MWEEEPKWHGVCLGPGNRPDRKELGDNDSGKLGCEGRLRQGSGWP